MTAIHKMERRTLKLPRGSNDRTLMPRKKYCSQRHLVTSLMLFLHHKQPLAMYLLNHYISLIHMVHFYTYHVNSRTVLVHIYWFHLAVPRIKCFSAVKKFKENTIVYVIQTLYLYSIFTWLIFPFIPLICDCLYLSF